MLFREARTDDAAFLWVMLTYAALMEPGGEASVAKAQENAAESRAVALYERAGFVTIEQVTSRFGTPSVVMRRVL